MHHANLFVLQKISSSKASYPEGPMSQDHGYESLRKINLLVYSLLQTLESPRSWLVSQQVVAQIKEDVEYFSQIGVWLFVPACRQASRLEHRRLFG